jgi:hypothetical protein
VRQQCRRDGGIISEKITFGDAEVWPERFLKICEPDNAAGGANLNVVDVLRNERNG